MGFESHVFGMMDITIHQDGDERKKPTAERWGTRAVRCGCTVS